MRHQRSIILLLTFGALVISTTKCSAQPGLVSNKVSICQILRAKAMPQGLSVAAMKFTGPSGGGRRGSAGFVVQSQDLVEGTGTRWQFVFQRDPSGYGFQVIDPFGSGHILVTVHSGVKIHRGGSWGCCRI